MTVLGLLEVHCIKDDAVNFIIEREQFFLPALALLSNHTAKVFSPEFYDLKQELLEEISVIAMEENPYNWRTFTSFDGGSHPWIFYIDSDYFPQMSFHGSIELPGNAKGKWSGVPQQEQSLTILANACKKQGFKGGIISHHKQMAVYMAYKSDSIGETQIVHKTRKKEISFSFNRIDGLKVSKLKDGELIEVLPAESQQESAAIQSFFSSIAEKKEEKKEAEESEEEKSEETEEEISSDETSEESSEESSDETSDEGESSDEGNSEGELLEKAPKGGEPQEDGGNSENSFEFEEEKPTDEIKPQKKAKRQKKVANLSDGVKVSQKTFDEFTFQGEVKANPKVGNALTRLSSTVDYSRKTYGHDRIDAKAFVKALLTSPHKMTSAKHGYKKGEVYLFIDTNCKNCHSEYCTWFHYSEFTRTVIESTKAFENIHVWSGSKCRPEMNEKTQMRFFEKLDSLDMNLEQWIAKFNPRPGSRFIFIGEAFNITMNVAKMKKALSKYNAVWLDSKKKGSDRKVIDSLISANVDYKPKCYNTENLLRGLHSA